MKVIQVAVIGIGRIGRMHAENLSRIPGVRVKAISRRQTNTDWARALGVETIIGDLDTALQDPETEAVLIAASSDAHVSLIEEAAAAGRHVFCEKPVSFDPERILAAGAACAKAGVKLQIGYNRRFDPDFRQLRDEVAAGRVGELRIIKITNRDPRLPDLAYVPRSGGLFMDFSVHDFDMCRFLSGVEVRSVYAAGAALHPEIAELGDIDTAVITLELENGAFCVIDNSRETNYGYDQRIEVFGSLGALAVNNRNEFNTSLSVGDGVFAPRPMWSFVERYRESFFNELNAFIDCVRDGGTPEVGADDAAVAVGVARTAMRAEDEGKRLASGVLGSA